MEEQKRLQELISEEVKTITDIHVLLDIYTILKEVAGK